MTARAGASPGPDTASFAMSSPAPPRLGLVVLISLLTLLAAASAGVALGAVTLSPAEVWTGLTSSADPFAHNVIWEIRIPRLLGGMAVGAALAVAGLLLQGVTRNPLADPTIMGITAASGLASAFAISRDPQIAQWAIMAACLAGAVAGSLAIFVIAWRGAVSPVRLALAGVALSAFFGAFIVGILSSSRTFIQTSLGFLAGGLYGSSWSELQNALPYLGAGLLGSTVLAGRLNVLSLGDDIAAGLGVLTDRTRLAIMVVVGVLTAAAVSIAGLVSFVGLVCPHLARFVIGNDNRYLVPVSALFGATLVTAADLVARLVIRPSEVPMGIITAAIGAPFLLYLLRAKA